MTMKCQYCFADIEDGLPVCPLCGKELTVKESSVAETGQKPAKKKNSRIWKIITGFACVVVLALALTVAILYSMGLTDVVASKLGNTFHSLKFWRENDLYYHQVYTADTDKVEKQGATVIATVGDQKLTNGELQAHYWSSIYDALSYNTFSTLDATKPLSEQIYDEKSGTTYEQLFLESALESWRRYATLIQLSKENGFTLTADEQAYFDSIPEKVTTMAKQYGYEDLETFLKDQFVPGCSSEAYLSYNCTSYLALTYYDYLLEDIMPTEDQINSYFTENEAEFTAGGITKTSGDYYNVRHILISPTGDEADGSYTEEDWEKWRATAQSLLDQFLAGDATEENFAALAKEKSTDTGSASNGGLYSNLSKDASFVKEFKEWYLDESRKPGDTGVIRTEYGYHVMYFSGSRPIWEAEAEAAIITENTEKLLADAGEKWPMTVNYKQIKLGNLDMLS